LRYWAMPMTRWEFRIVPCLLGKNVPAKCLKMLVMRFVDVQWPAPLSLLRYFAARYTSLVIIIITRRLNRSIASVYIAKFRVSFWRRGLWLKWEMAGEVGFDRGGRWMEEVVETTSVRHQELKEAARDRVGWRDVVRVVPRGRRRPDTTRWQDDNKTDQIPDRWWSSLQNYLLQQLRLCVRYTWLDVPFCLG